MRMTTVTPGVRRAIDALTSTIGAWSETEAIALVLTGEDVYDPYFFLSLDVYTRGPVRSADLREREFGDVVAFEHSALAHKDRFLIGDMPVRIEYKAVDRFEQLADAAEHGRSGIRDEGTYAFHRVVEADTLYARTGWFENLRERLGKLPDAFWAGLRSSFQAVAEHTYADLSAAAVRDDALYFALSAGRFLSALFSLLFAANRMFEPSPRSVSELLCDLDVPDSFPANLENFVSPSQLSLGQRSELAEMMVTGVISMYGGSDQAQIT